MTHDDAFVESIVEAPDDDAPRLIYADWLEEHEDPDRAAFVRVQIELARLPEGDPRREELERREDELLTEHEGRWTAPLRAVLLEDIAMAVFHRGFVEEMSFWGQDRGTGRPRGPHRRGAGPQRQPAAGRRRAGHPPRDPLQEAAPVRPDGPNGLRRSGGGTGTASSRRHCQRMAAPA